MIFTRLLVLFWAFLLATAAIAGEEYRTKIKIEIDDEDTGHRSFKFDSEDAGFNLNDLAVGETRELTGESGNKALVTRTEDGFVLDVDGEKIDLSNLHDVDEARAVHVDGDDKKVRKHKKVRMIKTNDDDAITIISGKAIDEETRERIREVLESSGQGGEVVFIDSSELQAGAQGRHEVRVIKKEVNVTN